MFNSQQQQQQQQPGVLCRSSQVAMADSGGQGEAGWNPYLHRDVPERTTSASPHQSRASPNMHRGRSPQTSPSPPFVTPNMPATSHRNDLFFSGSAAPNRRPSEPSYSPRSHEHSPHHVSSVPLWNAPSHRNTPPHQQHSAPAGHADFPDLPYPGDPSSDAASQNEVDSPAEEKDLEIALEMSRSEASKRSEYLDELKNREEEELARALEASMSLSGNSYVSGTATVYDAQVGSSRTDEPAATSIAEGASLQRDNSWRSVMSSQMSEDEALARKIAEEEEEEEMRRQNAQSPPSGQPSFGKLPDRSQARMSDDEALARRLAAEDDDRTPPPSAKAIEANVESSEAGAGSSESNLPEYTPRRRSSPQPDEQNLHSSSSTASGSTTPNILATPQPDNAIISMPVPELPSPTTNDPDLLTIPPPYADSSRDSIVSTASDPLSSADTNLLRSNSSSSATSNASAPGQLLTTERSDSSSLEDAEETSASPPPNPNQFLDKELLRGISIGFNLPSISDSVEPMSGSMPNIVSLPYGRCPPLHLKAPSWKNLLKLLARLSSTRMEPTIEALAVAKHTCRLRTVIQFVKSHPMSPNWHSVLWFTIDHPVPPAMPGASKYTSNDVNVLPWSYTLGSIPAMLRDGGDSQISKTYTVPTTDSMPYPTLPMSFPNLAMYLQAALDESRRHVNDSSSGIRKLAKIMDQCYPSEDTSMFPDRERQSVGGIFKKVMKRGSGKNGKKSGRGGNEDTYELVTPFVPDEWG